MPIRIKTDLEWGDLFYLKVDPDQKEYLLIGVSITPGNVVTFTLSHQGEEVSVYDYETTREPDELKKLDSQKGAE